MYSQLERACYLCRAIVMSKCRSVQRTVVPGNWMDNRQSDSPIVALMESNASGWKGGACGDILRGNLAQHAEVNYGRRTNYEKNADKYTEICWEISHKESPVQESCTPGFTGGVPCEGHVYQPKPHVRFCRGVWGSIPKSTRPNELTACMGNNHPLL